MIERYIQFLGLNDTIKLLIANEKALIPAIRVNTLKIKPSELKIKLEDKHFELIPIKYIPYGFKIKKAPQNLGSLHEFLYGYFYLQKVVSMLPAHILNPKPGDIVIDMCAAPGSKATQLAQIMENKGALILIEKNPKRIPALDINLKRMGVLNSIILNIDAIIISNTNLKADKILLDAPCTGEGLIREDVTRKKSRNLNDIKRMAKIQKKLLEAGLKALKPGGQLVYSTCSIAPEENELVINEVLQKLSDYSIIKIPHSFGINGLDFVYGKYLTNDLKLSQRLYPHLHDTIGFFICLIQRKK
ncbi:MAG: RsmB/NOP family class I SAM-dependent RNA methyltransferase [Promethearchaeota archaeon]